MKRLDKHKTVLFLVMLFLVSLQLGKAKSEETERIISITAKKFEYNPSILELKLGEPVVIELKSLDRKHGFKVPALGLETVVKGGETTRVRIVPDKVGEFPFHCSVFCGSGHEDMVGKIVVKK